MGNPATFTVRTESRHPQIGRDYDASEHRYEDSYVDPDEVTYPLHLDAFPGSETVETIVITGPNGKPTEIEIERLELPDDAAAYEWQIEQQDGPFEKSVTTPIEQTTIGGTTGVFGTPYELTVEVPEPGAYDIELQVRLESGGGPTHSRTFEINDFLVVSIGDSYASGEGNPDVAGEPEGFQIETEWWEVVVVPILAYKLTKEAVEWGFDQIQREFPTFTQATGGEIDMSPEPVWLEENAHRSLRAGPAVAAGLLENPSEGDVVTFVSFARSGAEIEDGLFGPRASGDDPIDGWIGNDGELDELRALTDRLGDRSIDALHVSIGGNDAGFSSRLSDLVKEDNPVLSLSLGDDDEARDDAKEKVDEALERLDGPETEPGSYDKLASELEEMDVDQVYVTEYPTAYFERTEGEEVRITEGCEIFSHADADIDRADARLMKESAEELNDLIRRKADDHDWVYVDGIVDGFRGRGYCAGEDSLYVKASESIVRQGDTDGTLHPNADGQFVYAESIKSALEPHVEEGVPPIGEDTPPGGEDTPPGGEDTPPGDEDTPPGDEETPPGKGVLSVREAVAPHDQFAEDPISVGELFAHFSPSPPTSVRALLRSM